MLLATFPANLVHIELIMMPFAVCYACFFVAAAVYRRSIRSEGTPRILTRLLALGLFYFSFMMQSLLVFYAVFLLYAIVTWPGRADGAGARLIAFLKRHADFIALPLLYWGVRAVWFRPFGEYEGYNAFQHRLASVVGDWALALYGGLVVPLARSVHEIRQLPAVALVVLAAVLLLRPLWASAQWERQGRLVMLGFGLVCVGCRRQVSRPFGPVGKPVRLPSAAGRGLPRIRQSQVVSVVHRRPTVCNYDRGKPNRCGIRYRQYRELSHLRD